MNKISIDNLPENAYINAPVYLDEKYILLSPDIPVSSDMVKRLRDWGYTHVLSSGALSEAPPAGLSQAPENGSQTGMMESNLKEAEEQKKTSELFEEYTAYMDNLFARFREKNELRLNDISDKLKEIQADLKTYRRFMLGMISVKNESGSYNASHSVKTTILALAIGEVLKLAHHKLIDLGLAALLHRVGMMRIPEAVYLKEGALTPQEKKTIIAHPVLGFRILKESGFPMSVAVAVLEQNEKLDGSGYPRGITAEKISYFGRILTVASNYCAAVSQRPYKNELDGHSGIVDLLKGNGTQYDEHVLRGLVFVMSVYPMGTFVLLSNNARGLVIKTDLQNPKYPTLRLLTNEKGIPYAEKPIFQTGEKEEIKIVRSLNKEESEELKEYLRS